MYKPLPEGCFRKIHQCLRRGRFLRAGPPGLLTAWFSSKEEPFLQHQPSQGHFGTDDIEDLSPIVTRLNQRHLQPQQQYDDLFAACVHNVITEKECQDLIDRSEQLGYENALVNIGNGQQVSMSHVRNSGRCIIDDVAYAGTLYHRLLQKLQERPDILERVLHWQSVPLLRAVGLNERLRLLRYDPGCYFKPHSDGSYRRGNEAGPDRRGERSQLTFLLYLNDGYTGGLTRFVTRHRKNNVFSSLPLTLEDGVANDTDNSGAGTSDEVARLNQLDSSFTVNTRPGSVLLFEHSCYHEGPTVEQGRKYILRTEVMYT